METSPAIFTALADPHRRRTLEVLRNGPLRASELAESVALPRNVMSRHLNVLREHGLVDVEMIAADGRARLYRINVGGLERARSWIERIEQDWVDHLRRFERLAQIEAARDASPDNVRTEEGES